ncbi:hypothetical protein Hypma_009390 [Hypsizygus marmoreus]|uniref:Uncharacterized protein n=1 Tax=Hypsizygus marmoreus TaxID=39966 RepID=A0A369JQJ1_HYPMA|nr:hypothetical protein Hypma_009390 [Hypsizygus marmoreus]
MFMQRDHKDTPCSINLAFAVGSMTSCRLLPSLRTHQNIQTISIAHTPTIRSFRSMTLTYPLASRHRTCRVYHYTPLNYLPKIHEVKA